MRIFYFDSTKTNEPCDTAQPSIILYCSTAPNETIKTFTTFGTTGIIRHYEDSFLSGETQNHPGKPYRKFVWKTKIHIFRIKQRRNNGKLWLNLVLASPSDSSSQPTKKKEKFRSLTARFVFIVPRWFPTCTVTVECLSHPSRNSNDSYYAVVN